MIMASYYGFLPQARGEGPQVGGPAPDFYLETPIGQLTLRELAARVGQVILVSYDSYEFHPN